MCLFHPQIDMQTPVALLMTHLLVQVQFRGSQHVPSLSVCVCVCVYPHKKAELCCFLLCTNKQIRCRIVTDAMQPYEFKVMLQHKVKFKKNITLMF